MNKFNHTIRSRAFLLVAPAKIQWSHKFGALCHTIQSSCTFTLIVGEKSARVQQSTRNIASNWKIECKRARLCRWKGIWWWSTSGWRWNFHCWQWPEGTQQNGARRVGKVWNKSLAWCGNCGWSVSNFWVHRQRWKWARWFSCRFSWLHGEWSESKSFLEKSCWWTLQHLSETQTLTANYWWLYQRHQVHVGKSELGKDSKCNRSSTKDNGSNNCYGWYTNYSASWRDFVS